MKRRDALRLVPLGAAGIAGLSSTGRVLADANGRNDAAVPLALQYTGKVREHLRRIRETQTEDLMEAAYAIARTVENGGRCWNAWDAGHTNADLAVDRMGEPDIFTSGYNPADTKDGDFVLARSADQRLIEDVQKKDIFVVGAPSPWSGDARHAELLQDDIRAMQLWPYADVWVETGATVLGGIIDIPGMPAPVGPITGVDGPVTMWMMLSDACRILARRGVSVPVKGDEPAVTGEKVDWRSFSGWVSLNDPLMDNYFDEVMRQIEMIGAELGTIRAIASMCVDTIMADGTVWCYSKYSSIAGEANTRRSGLSLTTGVNGEGWRAGFKGSAKDCAILGVTRPDDPMDLAALDTFRKAGMKTACLGPMTRAVRAPEGRTVPREADFHAGRMCDTYGLFAIPGFERKVAPTSGVIVNQLYWAVVMEVVEQFIRRSGGDVPGVFFSAALKNGTTHMHRMLELKRNGVKGY